MSIRGSSGLCLGILAASLISISISVSARAADPVNPAALKFFEDRIRPVLATSCYSCHGEEKQKSGLRADSLAALLKGGERGPALNLKDPESSLLLQAIRHGEQLQMPPKQKLPPSQIADLTTWVKMGAPWPADKAPLTTKSTPGGGATVKDTKHWAFQPPLKPAIPNVRNAAWPQTPIDQFVLAQLEAKGLRPAPAADRRTLIRRATLDLTGLPPTPDEVEAFLADAAPDAFARVIDRLLASPHYGERWGRHWLDVARYADSNGMDENLAYVNAHRYRDYVIAAFNADKRFDLFVKEQIAGDLLPPTTDEQETHDRLVATGFLALGPKMLAEDDPQKMEMDIIDEQLDTVGRTFMGMTLGCARCHDHKFDPITMADYYGLAGIFKSTKTMENFKVVAVWHERPLASPREAAQQQQSQRAVQEATARISALTKKQNEHLVAEARARAQTYWETAQTIHRSQELHRSLKSAMAPTPPPGTLVFEAEEYTRGNVKKDFEGYGKGIGVIYNQGTLPNFAEYDLTVPAAGVYQLEIRYAAADSRPIVLTINGDQVRTDAAGQVTGSWFPDTQKWFPEGLIRLSAGTTTIRFERTQPFPHFDKLALVPRPDIDAAALHRPLNINDEARRLGLNAAFLRQWVEFLAKQGKSLSREELAAAAAEAKGPFALPEKPEQYYAPEAALALHQLRDALRAIEQSVPVLPQAMSVSEGQPQNLRIHLRGSHLTLGAEAPRCFPQAFATVPSALVDKAGSGRLQLAEWLAEPRHPLTSRVLANRVWRWHFGRGLVLTTDNFGTLGDLPVHQPLLDWLAMHFVEGGWSVKSLHRTIMLSSTYQMSSQHDPQAANLDPDNRYYWRWERRRLEAEAVRDALLAVSGTLDLTMGGTILAAKPREYVTGTANRNYDRYDSRRRSVYLPVIRSALYDVFQAFDFPDPSTPLGDRPATTVAPQALFMLNSELARQTAAAFAQRTMADPSASRVENITRAYLLAFGRPPEKAEVSLAATYLERLTAQVQKSGNITAQEASAHAWQSLCATLLRSNEFIMMD